MYSTYRMPKNLLTLTVHSIILLSIIFYLPNKVKAATLIVPNDYISNDTLSTPNITHSISFIIPKNGHDIIATDYIRIILTNFIAVTAPRSGSGWSGVPTFGVAGNVAYVTNITATAGDGIAISGITATNPADSDDFDVTIQIANDVNGTIVYDSATFDAEPLKRSISTSVSIGTATSSLEFFGYTSPGAFVTILLNGGVAGTTSADGGGGFHKLISGLEQSQNYSVSMFAQDSHLRQTQTVSFIITTIPFMTVTVSNIVLPTTLAIDNTSIYQGDYLGINGRAHPESQITVFVESYSDVVQANSSGYWSYNFDSYSNPLPTGGHITYAKEVVTGGYESVFTQGVSFSVNSCSTADLNCDGYVNLVDFSILMYYWNQTNPANHRADTNTDGIVNLTDFSIMMFHWTG